VIVGRVPAETPTFRSTGSVVEWVSPGGVTTRRVKVVPLPPPVFGGKCRVKRVSWPDGTMTCGVPSLLRAALTVPSLPSRSTPGKPCSVQETDPLFRRLTRSVPSPMPPEVLKSSPEVVQV
jgi:hypothetical protein